jgi:hypothetical protein
LTAYSLRQRTDQAFYRDAGPDFVDYITWLEGEIAEIDDTRGADLAVGETRAGVVDFWRALRDHTPLWELLDNDTDASTYAAAVCDPAHPSELREPLASVIGAPSLLLITKIEIVPHCRGKKLGLWAMYRILDLCPGSLPIILPAPIPLPSADSPTPEAPSATESAAWHQAAEKLRRYWSRIGFEPFFTDEGGRTFLYLNPDAHQPHRSEVLSERYDGYFSD